MRTANATQPTSRSRRAIRSISLGLAIACASLTGCLDVLDSAHYRARVDGNVPRIDATADHTTDALDVRDVHRMDSIDIADAPHDIADEDAAIDEPVTVDVTPIDDVIELEASFDDVPDVIVAADVPDIPCPTCRSGQTCCAGVCVNTSINEQNCGACGAICPDNSVCQSGRCGRCPLTGITCGREQRCCILGLLCGGILCP